MSNENSIVSRIRALANAQGLSLTNLEIKLNLGNGTISRWSKSAPNSDKLTKVADHFHVTTDYLLGRDSSPNSHYAQTLSDLQKPISINFSTQAPQSSRISSLSDEDMAALFCATEGMTIMTVYPTEQDLIRKFRCLDLRGQSAVLNTLDHEYNTLPGDKASSSPKEA